MQAILHAVQAADLPRLPGRHQRGDVIRVMTAIAPRLGLRAGALRALLTMIHMTKPSDWTSSEIAPICYRQQIKVAAASGVTTRTTRSHEAVLESLGLIAKTVGADGSRGKFAKGAIIQGISFAPLIERFSALLALADALEEETRQAEIFRRRCSAARRSFNQALSRLIEINPKHPSLPTFLAFKAGLPRRYDGMNIDGLRQLLDSVDGSARDCWGILSQHAQTSGTPEVLGRPHIQATTETVLESCSGSSAVALTARMRAEADPSAAAPDGAPECEEKQDRLSDRGHKPKFTETFSPQQLYQMASEDMRMYIDAVRRDPNHLTQDDFVQAAIAILPAIGINPSAWDEAQEAMGDMAAALSVLVIDANRFHPVKPIHSPGGALRSFARLARGGRLNLHGSLIGLKQRTRMA